MNSPIWNVGSMFTHQFMARIVPICLGKESRISPLLVQSGIIFIFEALLAWHSSGFWLLPNLTSSSSSFVSEGTLDRVVGWSSSHSSSFSSLTAYHNFECVYYIHYVGGGRRWRWRRRRRRSSRHSTYEPAHFGWKLLIVPGWNENLKNLFNREDDRPTSQATSQQLSTQVHRHTHSLSFSSPSNTYTLTQVWLDYKEALQTGFVADMPKIHDHGDGVGYFHRLAQRGTHVGLQVVKECIGIFVFLPSWCCTSSWDALRFLFSSLNSLKHPNNLSNFFEFYLVLLTQPEKRYVSIDRSINPPNKSNEKNWGWMDGFPRVLRGLALFRTDSFNYQVGRTIDRGWSWKSTEWGEGEWENVWEKGKVSFGANHLYHHHLHFHGFDDPISFQVRQLNEWRRIE